MSRTGFSAARGVINKLECNNIQIIHDNSKLKWSGRLKHPHISLTNKGATAKLSLFRSGEKAVMGSKGVVIGTDNLSWTLDINKGQTIQCGIALVSRDLSNIAPGPDLLSTQIDVSIGNRIILLLNPTENTLIIENNGSRIVLDTTEFTGQTMYPWLSDVNGTSGFTIKINEYQIINMNIDTTGTARINTITEVESTAPLIIDAGDKGIDLGAVNVSSTNITTAPGEDFSVTSGTSGQGLTVQDPNGDVEIDTKLQVDTIEPKSGSTSLVIKGGGASGVVIDNTGDVTINPGSLITQCVKAPSGSSTKLTNELGVGVQVSATGVVTFDITPKFDEIQSNAGNDLTLTEGTSGLGLAIKDSTGEVEVTGSSLSCNTIDTTSATTMSIGSTTATKLELASSGVDTEVKGNLNVAEGLDVTGNITVTGTVDGIDIAQNTVGLVSVHSDVNITSAIDNEILQFDSGSWVNKDLATAGVAATGHTHTATDVTDFNSAADARITLQKGAVNGIATLDSAGKVPLSQLSLNNVEYCGAWNASTNTPTLNSGSGTQGCYYVVSVAGSTNLDGVNDWQINDWAIYNGTVWEKVDNTDAVVSVAGKQGAVTLQASDLTDVTDAGSGAIITSGERTQISNLASTYLALSGGTMSGTINMGSNNITNANDVGAINDVTVGNTMTVTNLSTFQGNCAVQGNILLGTGLNQVTLTPGLSAAARTYDIQDQGVAGTLAVIKKSTDIAVTAYTSNTTLIIPAGTTSMTVKLWGAGGHSGVSTGFVPGGNGGGGGYATSTLAVSPGETYEISIGAPGGGGAGGLGEPGFRTDHGGSGGGMTMVHQFTGGQYHVVAVAAGGGGGNGRLSTYPPQFHGGAGGVDGDGTSGGDTPISPPSGGAGGIAGGPFPSGFAGGAFNNPVAALGSVGGGGGAGATAAASSNRGGAGGGGSGYGGGGGAGFNSNDQPCGGAGGANYGDSTINGSGRTPGENSDSDKQNVIYGIQNAGLGGLGVNNSQTAGAGGAVLVYLTQTTYSIGLGDDNVADANPADNFLINGTDKTAGTGNGGNLILRGGTSAGGTAGSVEIGGKVNFIPQTEPSGVAGDVYYNSSTNKLRVHNGTSWVDLH